MFTFDEKDITSLQESKIKNHFTDFPLTAQYLIIYEDKCLFISKSKNKYKVCASGSCHFEPVRRNRVWDILYFTDDLEKAKYILKSYLQRLIWDSIDVMHSTPDNKSTD